MSTRRRKWVCGCSSVFALLGLFATSAAATEAPVPPTADQELEAYVKELTRLRERWLNAAALVSKRHFDKARSLLSQPLPGTLSDQWRGTNESFAWKASSGPNLGGEGVMDWLLSMGACAAAERTLSSATDPKLRNESRLRS